MNEMKWTKFFQLKNGMGIYIILLIPYIVMLMIMFLVSKFSFDFLQFENSVVLALFVIAILTLSILMKLPKLRNVS